MGYTFNSSLVFRLPFSKALEVQNVVMTNNDFRLDVLHEFADTRYMSSKGAYERGNH